MEGSDGVDDRTFRVNFSGEGADSLRDRVKDKLKEFMGDYTDDILVEYVIVLLRNGKRKDEAQNELNVFLGDDTDSFVSWLWDHLSSSWQLYAQSSLSNQDETAKLKPLYGKVVSRNDSQHFDSESGREEYTAVSRSRRNRDWRGLVRDVDPPPLRSSEIDSVHLEEKTLRNSGSLKRSRSPRLFVQEKQSREEEQHQRKRDAVSGSSIGASRRLLQFAVREAVGTLRPSNLRSEASSKRLRSVVSTSMVDSSTDEQPQRKKSVARVPSALTTAIKAAADAAEDVVKLRCSGNIFKRLGHNMDVSQVTHQLPYVKPLDMMETVFGPTPVLTHSDYVQRKEFNRNMTMLEREKDFSADSASDDDGFEDINVMGSRGIIDASQTGTSGEKEGESLTVHYGVAKNKDEVARKKFVQGLDSGTATNVSDKIVNISVNVNTWKPPHYRVLREDAEVKNCKGVQENKVFAGRSGAQLSKENTYTTMASNEHESSAAHTQRESQKNLSANPGRPLEDAESRTVFVSNVHFAASKDTLSRHFNKFGEVLRVVMVTDATTGQPKGSVYVEFMRKESAEKSLSLNGTSFMSRILKVVRKNSTHQEVAPLLTWPRMARASPFVARARVPFPRGIPSLFRTRLPIKPGARSMQWKRNPHSTTAGEGSASVQNGATTPNNSFPSAARSLTYIRTGPKPLGINAPAPAFA